MRPCEIINSIPENIKSLLSEKELLSLAIGMTDKNRVFLINGPQGPTGKTTLAKWLRKQGYKVYEEFEMQRIELNKKLT
ncbi:hypothetical protein NST02_18010 [Robertmurraya sp. FSL W8-0741]|uniref:hypothetical protein n=1 Tax=Robertmurraya sp. FSL W8-0741 TaxID=2954629 RepID=UPI0030F8F4A5